MQIAVTTKLECYILKQDYLMIYCPGLHLINNQDHSSNSYSTN